YGENEVNSSTKNAQSTPAPDSVILEGQGKLPESLQKLLKGGSVPVQNKSGDGNIRFSEEAIVVPSNGKSSIERSSEIGQSVISIDLCLDFEYSSRIVLAPAQECPEKDLQQAVGLFQSLGKKVSVIKDIAGMVVTRTVAMLANESSLLVEEEVADVAGVDLAMRKGVNYPLGPLEWAEQWGWNSVVETLENLAQINAERYKTSEWLRTRAN
ncbi:MAG: 3-hydroxyacyl-CoA dehydrogenase family protein, partial [SAR324 cluster bacterium]|nr:3-hydroxyacyl-CoA dehydrogenase family protein [SAR324 cluster bacterium]